MAAMVPWWVEILSPGGGMATPDVDISGFEEGGDPGTVTVDIGPSSITLEETPDGGGTIDIINNSQAGLVQQRINELLQDLGAAKTTLEAKILETQAEAEREVAQISEILTAETERITGDIAAAEAEGLRETEAQTALRELARQDFDRQVGDLLEAQALVVANFERELGDLEADQTLEEATRARLREELLSRSDLAVMDLDRQASDLAANRDASIETLTRNLSQLVATKDQTIQGLLARAATGDAEAQRRVKQIKTFRNQYVRQTTDQAILQLNEAGDQARFDVGRAVIGAAVSVGEAKTAIARSGLRKSGSTLAALRQQEKLAQEEVRRTEGRAASTVKGIAMQAGGRVQQLRTQAAGDIADVMAANMLQDQELDRERERVELNFAQTYENGQATQMDIERQFGQDAAALGAQRAALQQSVQQGLAGLDDETAAILQDYSQRREALYSQQAEYQLQYTQTQDALTSGDAQAELEYNLTIERIKAATAESKRQLEVSLNTAGLAAKQQTEDIQAQSSLLTAGFERDITEVERQKTRLTESTPALLQAAEMEDVNSFFEGVTSLLGTVLSFV